MLLIMFRHPASLTSDELLADCDVRRLRRGGPGGQHRNKVETAVVLTHRPTGVVAEANERRSQAENLAQAVSRLRLKLAIAVRSPFSETPQQASAPSPLWQGRTAGGKIAVSASNEDFPTLLAESLDAVTAADFDLSAAALRLNVTPSQLARFLKREPTAWTLVNEARRTRGLRPLR
jgi:hypothetical protein